MLVEYRNCKFIARKEHQDIRLLTNVDEPYARKLFVPKEGDIVINIGAHVGKYTIPSANLTGSRGRVFAF
jgi:hypothetical protein